jgi:hypothetical protein
MDLLEFNLDIKLWGPFGPVQINCWNHPSLFEAPLRSKNNCFSPIAAAAASLLTGHGVDTVSRTCLNDPIKDSKSRKRKKMEDCSIYFYNPSLAAAILFTALYTIPTVFTLHRINNTRTWYWICVPIGGIFEIAGYAIRIGSVKSPCNVVSAFPGQPRHNILFFF